MHLNVFSVRTFVTFCADHDKKEQFGGPRFFVRIAGLEMHPLDGLSRTQLLKDELGIGLCNITKCCTGSLPRRYPHHRQCNHFSRNAWLTISMIRFAGSCGN